MKGEEVYQITKSEMREVFLSIIDEHKDLLELDARKAAIFDDIINEGLTFCKADCYEHIFKCNSRTFENRYLGLLTPTIHAGKSVKFRAQDVFELAKANNPHILEILKNDKGFLNMVKSKRRRKNNRRIKEAV